MMQAFKIYTSGHGCWKYGDLVATITADTFNDAVYLYLKHYLSSFFQRDLVPLGDGIRIAGTDYVFMPYPRMRVTLDGEEVIWDFFPTLDKALETAFAKWPKKWPKKGNYVVETYDFPLTYFSSQDQGEKKLWSIYSDGVRGFVNGQLLGQVWAPTFRKAVIRWNESYLGTGSSREYRVNGTIVTTTTDAAFHQHPLQRVILKAGDYPHPILPSVMIKLEKDQPIIQNWAASLQGAIEVAKTLNKPFARDGVNFESVDLVRWNEVYHSV